MSYTSDVLNNLPIYFDGSDGITTEIFPNSLAKKHASLRETLKTQTLKQVEDTSR
jgi:hypothetical protein